MEAKCQCGGELIQLAGKKGCMVCGAEIIPPKPKCPVCNDLKCYIGKCPNCSPYPYKH